MTSASTNLAEPQLLVSAALFLMTQHARSQCPGICRAIAQHFAWLARHPAPGIQPQERRLYRRLAMQWGEMAAARDPRAASRDALVAPVDGYLQ